jgi:hypothetical protein
MDESHLKPTLDERMDTAEERIEILREAVEELQEAFNNLVNLAVRDDPKPQPQSQPQPREQIGTRGPTRCADPRSGNVGHLCLYGHHNPPRNLCQACIDELS